MASGIVLGGALRCRKSPNGDVWGKFSNGTFLNVSEVSGYPDWYQTTWQGSVGYVMKAYVAVAGDTVKVTGSNVNVRNSPSTSGTTVLYTLSSPSTATVKSVATGWVQIQPSGKSIGWISADYVNKNASGSSSGDTGTITDDGHTGDSSSTYTNAKCIGNIYVYERNNPYDVVVLQYYGLISGNVTVTDAGADQWMNYSNDGMLYTELSGVLLSVFKWVPELLGNRLFMFTPTRHA